MVKTIRVQVHTYASLNIRGWFLNACLGVTKRRTRIWQVKKIESTLSPSRSIVKIGFFSFICEPRRCNMTIHMNIIIWQYGKFIWKIRSNFNNRFISTFAGAISLVMVWNWSHILSTIKYTAVVERRVRYMKPCETSAI